jgi:hypothetical protein
VTSTAVPVRATLVREAMRKTWFGETALAARQTAPALESTA